MKDSHLVYAASTSHDPTQDTGINIDGLDIPWPLPVGVQSVRDKELPLFSQWG